jgi:hypothetical protein
MALMTMIPTTLDVFWIPLRFFTTPEVTSPAQALQSLVTPALFLGNTQVASLGSGLPWTMFRQQRCVTSTTEVRT